MSTRYLLILPILSMLVDIVLSTDAKVWRHLSENQDCNYLFFMVRDLSGAPISPELSLGVYKRVDINSWDSEKVDMHWALRLSLRFTDVRLKPVAGGVKTDLTIDFIDQTLKQGKENWKLDTIWEHDRGMSIYIFRQHNTGSEDKFLSVVEYGKDDIFSHIPFIGTKGSIRIDVFPITVNEFLEMQESQQKLEEQLQICSEAKEAAEQRIWQLEDDKARAQTLLDENTSRIELLEAQSTQLKQTNEEMMTDSESLKRNLEAVEKKKAEFEKELLESKTREGILKKRIEEMESTARDLARQRDNAVSQGTEEKQKAEQTISRLRDELQSALRQSERMKTESETALKLAGAESKELKALVYEKGQADQRVEHLGKELKAAKEEQARSVVEMETLERSKQSLIEQVHQGKQEREKEQQQWERQERELTDRLVISDSEKAEMIGIMEKKLKHLESECIRMQNEHIRLSEDTDAKHRDLVSSLREEHQSRLERDNAIREQEKNQRTIQEQAIHATNTGLISELAAKDADLRDKDLELKQLRDALASKVDGDDEREQRHSEEQARAEESIAEQRREREAVESTLRDERKDSDIIWGIASCTVGAVLLVIGYFVVAMRWRAEEEHEEEMEGELIAQSQMFKKPHPLVPVVPSAHAGRLGVHENPAVRDVFGMPKHWDVTPGEGFHVSRMTSDGSAPGTTRGTRKSSVVLDVKEGDMEGAQGLSKVSEHGTDGADMELSEENVVAEGGEQLDL